MWARTCCRLVGPVRGSDESCRAAGVEQPAPGMTRQSFALYLVEQAPNPVQQKLEAWGVLDYRALFRRAIGLHSVFSEVPAAVP